MKPVDASVHMRKFVYSLSTERLKWLALRVSEELDKRRLSDTLDPINYKLEDL